MANGNLIANPLEKYVQEQIKTRQEVHGLDGTGGAYTLDPTYNQYLNGRNTWVKLASGVALERDKYKEVTGKELSGTQTNDGGDLAKNWILFNGLGAGIQEIENQGNKYNVLKGDRAGVSGDNKAYGVGGYEFGPSPMPGIESVDFKCLNRGSIKKSIVKLKAHNKTQFNIIDALYLRLGYSVLLEWGENVYLKKEYGAINVNNTYFTLAEKLFEKDYSSNSDYSDWLRRIEQFREYYNGNYEGVFGTISNFSWTFQDDGTYDITLEIISLGDIVESLKANLPPLGTTKSNYTSVARKNELKAYSTTVFPNSGEFYGIGYPALKAQLEEWYNNAYLARKGGLDGTLIDVNDDLAGYKSGNKRYQTDIEPNAIKPSTISYLNFYLDRSIPNADARSQWEDWSDERIAIDAQIVNENIYDALRYAGTQWVKDTAKAYQKYNVGVGGGATLNAVRIGTREQVIYKNYVDWYDGRRIMAGIFYGGKGSRKLDPNKTNLFIHYSLTATYGDSERTQMEYSDRKTFPFRQNQVNIINQKINSFFTSNPDQEGFVPYLGSSKYKKSIDPYEKFTDTYVNSLKVLGTYKNIGPEYLGENFWEDYDIGNNSSYPTKGFNLSFLLEQVFQYFVSKGLAGGTSDPRFEEGATIEGITDTSNRNRIFKYLSDVKKVTKNAVFKSKISDQLSFTVGASDWFIGYEYPNQDQQDIFKQEVKISLGRNSTYKYQIPFFSELYIDQDKRHFMTLGNFLHFLEKKVIPKIEKTKQPILNIDWNNTTSICYISDNTISTDIRKCYVPNSTFFNGSNLVQNFRKSKVEFKQYLASGEKWGLVNNIFLNINRLEEIVKSVDKKGNISIFKIVKTICDDINECLGNINNLEPVIDETNTLRIIDQTPIPGIKKISKHLGIPYDDSEEVILNLFGYKPKENSKAASSNFVHKVGITTEINKKYATMISIGATSAGSVPGLEATAFSSWNKGITDRFKTNIVDANSLTNTTVTSLKEPIKNLKEQNENVIKNYKEFIKQGWERQGLIEDADGNKVINSDVISINKETVSNFYNYAQAKITLETTKESGGQSSVGFLPFNLKIDMDGLSGIKIYNRIKVNTEFLPLNYGKTLDFIVTSVDHKIKDNNWITHLDTLATSNMQKPKSSDLSIVTSKVLELSNTNSYDPPFEASGYGEAWNACGRSRNLLITDPTVLALVEKKFVDNPPLGDRAKAEKLLRKIAAEFGITTTSTGLCGIFSASVVNQFWYAAGDSSQKISTFQVLNAGGTSTLDITDGLGNTTTFSKANTVVKRKKGDLTLTSGGFTFLWGHAKLKTTHDKLMEEVIHFNNRTDTGYKRYQIGKNMGRTEAINLIKDLEDKGALFPGDIIAYWDHSGVTDSSGEYGYYQEFGHIQVYISNNEYVSDFLHGRWVYGATNADGSLKGNCWDVILLKHDYNVAIEIQD